MSSLTTDQFTLIDRALLAKHGETAPGVDGQTKWCIEHGFTITARLKRGKGYTPLVPTSEWTLWLARRSTSPSTLSPVEKELGASILRRLERIEESVELILSVLESALKQKEA